MFLTELLLFLVPPGSPLLHSTIVSNNSISLQWRLSDDGSSPLTDYYLHYQTLGGSLKTRHLSPSTNSYILQDLSCGTSYEVYVVGRNTIGKGNSSKILSISTSGSKPVSMSQHSIINVNYIDINPHIILQLTKWKHSGCSITSFSVQYKEIDKEQWLLCKYHRNIETKCDILLS